MQECKHCGFDREEHVMETAPKGAPKGLPDQIPGIIEVCPVGRTIYVPKHEEKTSVPSQT